MALRSKTSLWLALGLCACVAVVWGLHESPSEALVRRSANVASQPAVPALQLHGAFDVVGTAHPIALNAAMARAAMRDGTLRVTLPDGTAYPVKMSRQETDAFGQWSVIGQVDTPVGAQSAVLTFGGDAVFGTLPMPNGRMLRVVTNHGVVEGSLDGGLIPPGHGLMSDIAPRPKDDIVAMKAKAAARRDLQRRATPAASQRMPVGGGLPTSTPIAQTTDASLRTEAAGALPLVTITVIASYSDDLIALRGSEAAVQTEMSNLLAAANQAHIDSGTRVRLSLVRKVKLTVPSTMDNYDVLVQMTGDFVGGVDLETVRDESSADLVTFVRPYRNEFSNCGIAWVGGAGNHALEAEAPYGFSVVNVGPCGAHVMAHEIGHNLGSAHDRETDWIDGEYPHASYPYAFGYRRLTAPKFATIMAYTYADEPWIGRFSDPNSSACGAPCGIAKLSDNVRAFDKMAPAIADFRTTPARMTVSDSEAWEGDPDILPSNLRFPVRLNAYAMDAAVPFEARVIGGTATPGVDFVAGDPVASGTVPWGYRNETFGLIQILPDTEIEGDETIIVRITAPGGYPIIKDTAVLTIRDDDPRPHIRGRILVPPEDGCYIQATYYGINGPRDGKRDFAPAWPDCSFDFAVAPGANFELRQNFGVTGVPTAGRRFLPTVVNDVYEDRYLAIPAPQPLQVALTMVPSDPWIGTPTTLTRSIETLMGRTISETIMTPTYGASWTRSVYPGATLEVQVEAQSTSYRPWYFVFHDVWQDTGAMPLMRNAGTIVVRGGQPWPEGPAGRKTKVPVQIAYVSKFSDTSVQLGSVNVNWRTVDGTAKAGKDYTAASGTVTLTGSVPSAIVWVEINGNDVTDKARSFDVVIDPISPYQITNPSTRVTIADDDHRTGGPGQKTAAP
ncbi:putative secreted protein [Lysobacter dokdonensis DS-58]|uniref:Putative secreted protein n=1 Tax=Lysobacter dokdonensis DS-58 TaxID=1300345 RepID=A0A0A2WK42_9GAMM|nr:M12 family metallo-peptidase [Lysobacter dokdonensis]KGQ18620.1 putative secreted protein [Lysobacter dokdonensis DS-58]